MNNKILIVARAFPPAGGGGVQRIVKFSVYLQQLGWNVTVCTPLNETNSWIDRSREKELNKINVIRIQEKKISNSIASKIIRRFKIFDPYYSWSKKVISYFMEEKFDYNYLLTSGPPHSIHRVGIELKKKYKFKWVSDFRDHYNLAPNKIDVSPIHREIRLKFEQKIYDYSDLIITNTNTNKKEILRNFYIKPKNKIKTIYNGYDINDLKVKNINVNFPKNKINLLYLGGLRGDHIDGYFYRLLSMIKEENPEFLKNININIIGDISRKGKMIYELGLDIFFTFYKPIEFDKVGDYLSNSDGCLTWQNPGEEYKGTIAGKVFDYLGMEKPIFSLGQMDSELDKMINGNLIGIHTDVTDLIKAKEDFIYFITNLKKIKDKYCSLNLNYYNQFNRKNQTQQLHDLMLKLK